MSDGPMYEWFGLSYSNYLVMPRSCIQSMPHEWQARLKAVLEEWESTLHEHGIDIPIYMVVPRRSDGKFARDELADYQRGRRRLWENPIGRGEMDSIQSEAIETLECGDTFKHGAFRISRNRKPGAWTYEVFDEDGDSFSERADMEGAISDLLYLLATR